MRNPIPLVVALVLLAATPLTAYALPLDIAPAIASGNRQIVVIPLQFQDVKGVHSPLMIQNLFFAEGGDERSVRDYFLETSGGEMSLGGVVLPQWVTSSRTMAEYGNGESFGREPALDGIVATSSVCDMAREAVRLADETGFDFAPYVDAELGTVPIVVIHAGTPNDGSGLGIDVWSQAWGGCIGETYDGVYVDGFMTDSEFSPLGTNAHELGHLLLSLPDLYFGSNRVERYDLMASGSWGGDPTDEPRDLQVDWTSGQDPTHLGPYLKSVLGWTTIQTVPTDGVARAYALAPAEAATGVRALRLDVETDACETERISGPNSYIYPRGSRYFLLEYRTYNEGRYDGGIAGNGVVAWFIDECASEGWNGWWNSNVDDTRPRVRAIQESLPPMGAGAALSPIGLWSSTIDGRDTRWFAEVVELGETATVRVGKTTGDMRILNPSAPSTVSTAQAGSREGLANTVRADGQEVSTAGPSIWARDARLQFRVEPGAAWSAIFDGATDVVPSCTVSGATSVATCTLPPATPPGDYVIKLRSGGSTLAQRAWSYPVKVV